MFAGEREIWMWVDDLARHALGVSGPDFVDLYKRGVFWEKPIAHDIASVFPLFE